MDQSQPKQTSSRAVLFVIAIVICLVAVMVIFRPSSTSNAQPTITPQESAWTACTLFIKQQLGLPTSDAQRYAPEKVTALGSDQYAVEIFYAKYNALYRCELVRQSNGDMQLLSLKTK